MRPRHPSPFNVGLSSHAWVCAYLFSKFSKNKLFVSFLKIQMTGMKTEEFCVNVWRKSISKDSMQSVALTHFAVNLRDHMDPGDRRPAPSQWRRWGLQTSPDTHSFSFPWDPISITHSFRCAVTWNCMKRVFFFKLKILKGMHFSNKSNSAAEFSLF